MQQQPWALSQPVCPDCSAEPVAIVLRDAAEPRTRLEGECGRCGEWFDADDWFDPTAPLPCCPRCGLSPAKLAYVGQDGDRVERLLALDYAGGAQGA